MNYANHNIRSNLQEWKNRLARASFEQFSHQLKFLFNEFNSNSQIKSLLLDISSKYGQTEDELSKSLNSRQRDLFFENNEHRATYSFQLLKYFLSLGGNILTYGFFTAGNVEERKERIIEDYISPIMYYLHDSLDKSNSTIYLLERYKKRTEWFTKSKLYAAYSSADKSYEQILEDDLRLFLFDQGIEYPFSTPKSASGRADVIGEIETNDPLIIEIKIVDKKKGYGKERIKGGFTQITTYANDYNKNVGYLVIYNMDDVEINFKFNNNSILFPPSFIFNNKTFYFVVINVATYNSASNTGKLKELIITEQDLTSI